VTEEFQGRMPAQLREFWIHGEGAGRIRWGTEGAFGRCVRELSTESAENGHPIADPEGTCANLYHAATGKWPGAHRGEMGIEEDLEALVASMGDYQPVRWRGPLAPISRPTDDRRMFPPDTLTFQSMPAPYRFAREQKPGHEGAVTVGRILATQEYTDEDGEPWVWGWGDFLNPDIIPEVKEVLELAEGGVVYPSVDLVSYSARMAEYAGEPVTIATKGKVRAATLVAISAFSDLRPELAYPDDEDYDEFDPFSGDDVETEDEAPALPEEAVRPFDLDPAETFTVNSTGWANAPIAPRDATFDADDAVKRIQAWAGLGTDAPDVNKLASVFLWVNTENKPLLGTEGYRLPWGDIIDGKPYLIYHAIYAASALLEGGHGGLPNIPDADKAKLRSVITDIYAKLAKEFGDPNIRASWDKDSASMSSWDKTWDNGVVENVDSLEPTDTVATAPFANGNITENGSIGQGIGSAPTNLLDRPVPETENQFLPTDAGTSSKRPLGSPLSNGTKFSLPKAVDVPSANSPGSRGSGAFRLITATNQEGSGASFVQVATTDSGASRTIQSSSGEQLNTSIETEEFLGKYTEAKHPRDPKGTDEGGEWRDVPGHGPHGQIKLGGKWVYPKRRNKDHVARHAAPEHKARHAGEGEATSTRKTYRGKHKGPYRYHGARRSEDARKAAREAKAPETKKPETKAPEKKAVAKKVVAKRTPAKKAVGRHRAEGESKQKKDYTPRHAIAPVAKTKVLPETKKPVPTGKKLPPESANPHRNQLAAKIQWRYRDNEGNAAHLAKGGEDSKDRKAIEDAMGRYALGKDQEPEVNQVIRGSKKATPEDTADIAALDEAMDLSPLSRGVTVYRGFTNGKSVLPEDWDKRDLTGLEWKESGFVSTTVNQEGAEIYTGTEENRGFAVRMKLPKGFRAISIMDEEGGLDDEGEMVLPRDMTFKVTGDYGVQDGIRWLEVEPHENSKKPEVKTPEVKAPEAKSVAKKTVAKKVVTKRAPAKKAAPKPKRHEYAQSVSKNNPKIISDTTVKNGRWWDAVTDDTTSAGIPVRGLTVQGYKMDHAMVYKRNGVAYLVDTDTGLPDQTIVDQFEDFHATLPKGGEQFQKSYAWLWGKNPKDPEWGRDYEIANFVSLATGGNGSMTIWGRRKTPYGPSAIVDSLNHEFGHNVDSGVRQSGPSAGLSSSGFLWKTANSSDVKTNKSRLAALGKITYSGHFGGASEHYKVTPQTNASKPYPSGVTNYGKSSSDEDYAESMSMYLAGPIGFYTLPSGQKIPVYFRDIFPHRAEILDKVFPKVAAKQRAIMDKRGPIAGLGG